MRGKGVLVKFFGPWERAAGTEELYLPLEDPVTLSHLVERLASAYGDKFPARGDGLICLYDDERGAKALDGEDEVAPGSTVLFLGLIESG
jgi:molybdopterin converting factor small subunit